MSIAFILNKISSKNRSDQSFAKDLLRINQMLDQVFRTIASEKNQMLYPEPGNPISHKEHHHLVVCATKTLAAGLHGIAGNKHLMLNLAEFANTMAALDDAITNYQTNEHTLPQLLLVCSNLKGFFKNFDIESQKSCY